MASQIVKFEQPSQQLQPTPMSWSLTKDVTPQQEPYRPYRRCYSHRARVTLRNG